MLPVNTCSVEVLFITIIQKIVCEHVMCCINKYILLNLQMDHFVFYRVVQRGFPKLLNRRKRRKNKGKVGGLHVTCV